MSIPSVRLSPSTQRRTRMSTRLLVTGIGLAVIAAGLVAWVVKSADAQATVVMVTKPVSAFTNVQAGDVQIITVPAKSVAAGRYHQSIPKYLSVDRYYPISERPADGARICGGQRRKCPTGRSMRFDGRFPKRHQNQVQQAF